MSKHYDGEMVASDSYAKGNVCSRGTVRWVEDWRAFATVTSRGSNGPFDTKSEAKAALRHELRDIVEETFKIRADRAKLYG